MSSRCEEDLFDSIFTVEIDEEASPQGEGLNFENYIRGAAKYHRGRKVKHKEIELGKCLLPRKKNHAFELFGSSCYSSSVNREGWHQRQEIGDLIALPAKSIPANTLRFCYLDFDFDNTNIAGKGTGTYTSNYCL